MAADEGANGVPGARYCINADRRRQLDPVPAWLAIWVISIPGSAATTAMWPAVLPGGRPVGRRAATRGSTLVFGRSPGGGLQHSPKRPATGRWRTSM